jgi:hypothetical protein
MPSWRASRRCDRAAGFLTGAIGFLTAALRSRVNARPSDAAMMLALPQMLKSTACEYTGGAGILLTTHAPSVNEFATSRQCYYLRHRP